MRTVLDPIQLPSLRAPFLTVFRQIQRGKDFEKMAFIDGHYLLSGDSTGFYSSEKITSTYCMGKKTKPARPCVTSRYMPRPLSTPITRMVIPVFPEMIIKQDGSNKNDCERNASRHFYEDSRREHPHLEVIVVEDGLASNGPHVRDLMRLDLRYILGAKPGDHAFLFEQVDAAVEENRISELQYQEPDDQDKMHHFRYLNQVPLNKTNSALLINVLEYWQVGKNDKVTKFSWVTDLPITDKNVFDIMLAGRARWQIENETFNQGYNLGHSYGLGKENLSAVFTVLMILAFLIDQVQQMSCWLFQKAWEKAESKRYFWERIRSFFVDYRVDSMETILRAIAHGFERRELKEMYQT